MNSCNVSVTQPWRLIAVSDDAKNECISCLSRYSEYFGEIAFSISNVSSLLSVLLDIKSEHISLEISECTGLELFDVFRMIDRAKNQSLSLHLK